VRYVRIVKIALETGVVLLACATYRDVVTQSAGIAVNARLVVHVTAVTRVQADVPV